MRELLGTAYQQLSALLGDDSVREAYPFILAMRCRRCDSTAGVRCRTSKGAIAYPHTARIEDAVSAVAYLGRVDEHDRYEQRRGD
ncbi:hypothetical protein ACFV9C_42375 [Kribbella sp. NPDC059898]|uniref:zinc finger domain-containing protein n=1 Tax=Kribbella sp. NPDC059898 TaxID=3346995 RepID=UPI00364B6C43